jgi:PhzF family phenazine biosynthesis protein
MATGKLQRLTAFADDPSGGNPAGVWIGDVLPDDASMQKIASEVGYSETAFLAPTQGFSRTIRYFSPLAEVAFCGHATIASGVVLGMQDGLGEYHLESRVGLVSVAVSRLDSRFFATLTSVDTKFREAGTTLVDDVLRTLHWQPEDLDVSIPPAIAFAGAWHLVLALKTLERLNQLRYDFEALKELMLTHGLTTVQLVYRESASRFHSRNPFPVGGVVEDPATGAAAAALGGYLRDANLVDAPFEFEVRQGEAMGRPGLLQVSVPVSGGVSVTGTAVMIPPTEQSQDLS